jgi:predicted transcriptional regulator
VIGMISESDLRRAVKAEHKNYLNEQAVVEAQLDARLKAEELMSWPVVSVKLDADLVTVARRMIETRASCVLVLDEGHAKGIITHADMLTALVGLLKHRDVEAPAGTRSLTEMAYTSPVRELFEALANSGI